MCLCVSVRAVLHVRVRLAPTLSALGGADFEWAKTGDLRAEYMDTSETLGNDLDKVDIDPQFQV